MVTNPISSTTPPTRFSSDLKQTNKFEYLYFDLSTAFYKALQSTTCDCLAIATKVFILALPILFVLEAILDLAAFPFFWVANYICQDDSRAMIRSPTPFSTANHPETDPLPSPQSDPNPINPHILEITPHPLLEEVISPLPYQETAPPAPEPTPVAGEIIQIENGDAGTSQLTKAGQVLNDYVVQSWPVQQLIYRPVKGIWNYVFPR